ncbi:hypothetical protein HMPREF1199_00877 [Hoylesella oralis CC98A]|nr:hypothetical protein HMPREF1199_00877 [Hoylesella oralis CC98A]
MFFLIADNFFHAICVKWSNWLSCLLLCRGVATYARNRSYTNIFTRKVAQYGSDRSNV